MFNYISKGQTILDKFEELANIVKSSAQDNEQLQKEQIKLEQMRKYRQDYITNVILIFNSFFEYGFIND
jgi:hypothetical protein